LVMIQSGNASGRNLTAAQFAVLNVKDRCAVRGQLGLEPGERGTNYANQRFELRCSRVDGVDTAPPLVIAAAYQQRFAVGCPTHLLDMRQLGCKLALLVSLKRADDDGARLVAEIF